MTQPHQQPSNPSPYFDTCPKCNGNVQSWDGGQHIQCDYCGGTGKVLTVEGWHVVEVIEYHYNGHHRKQID